MNDQNYKTHRQLVPGYHGFTYLAGIVLLIGSVINVTNSTPDNIYSASLLVMVSILFITLIYYIRRFALVAQDRAIRAEESLRYYILTGQRLDQRLTTRQVVALRFASDEEFPALAGKAVEERMRPDDIKKNIRKWRADWYRV